MSSALPTSNSGYTHTKEQIDYTLTPPPPQKKKKKRGGGENPVFSQLSLPFTAAQLSLVLQDSLMLGAAAVVTAYLWHHDDIRASNTWLSPLLQAVIVSLGVMSNLAAQARLIAVERDWIVEICGVNFDHLACEYEPVPHPTPPPPLLRSLLPLSPATSKGPKPDRGSTICVS